MTMTRRVRAVARPYPDGWTVAAEMTINGRAVEQGTELRIAGERGRFLFVKHVRTPVAEWVDAIGPNGGGFRSFRPDRVRTVHRIARTREGASR